MKRLVTVSIICIILFVVGAIIFHIYRTQRAAIFFSREKNDNSSLMVIDNLTLDRNLHPEGKIKVSASVAYVDRNSESVKLENCYINYEKDDKNIYVEASDCLYIEDKSLLLKKNIKGKINDLVFFSKENGIFEFFIDDGYGNIKNGVSIIKNGNSINANTLDIYRQSKELFFGGNVRAIYEK